MRCRVGGLQESKKLFVRETSAKTARGAKIHIFLAAYPKPLKFAVGYTDLQGETF